MTTTSTGTKLQVFFQISKAHRNTFKVTSWTTNYTLSVQVFVKIGAFNVIRVVFVVVTHAKRRVTSITTIRTFFKARTRVDARQSFISTLEITVSLSVALKATIFQLGITVLDAFCVQ